MAESIIDFKPDADTTFRRRRLGVLVGGALVLAAIAVAGEPVADGVADVFNGSDGCSDTTTTYPVQDGDTLFDVGQRVPGDADMREVVDALLEDNGFETVPARLPAVVVGPVEC